MPDAPKSKDTIIHMNYTRITSLTDALSGTLTLWQRTNGPLSAIEAGHACLLLVYRAGAIEGMEKSIALKLALSEESPPNENTSGITPGNA
jgi:hypothetical protein